MTQLPSDGSPTPNVDEALQREIDEALAGQSMEQMMEDSAPDAAAKGDAAPAQDDGDIPSEVKRGRIAAIRGDEVFVEIAGIGKTQGIVSMQQFERPPRIGSIMDFVVTRFDEAEGLYFLSREGAVGRQTWDQITRGSAVEARVVGSNKGGLELEMVGNIRAFMPLSQIDFGRVEDPSSWVGQKVQAIVQELDRKAKRVVLSRRQFLEKTRDQQRGKTMAALDVNQIREGVVTSVMEYGAFVDIGGVDGLVHVSDIAYSRVESPSDVLKVGDKVTVKVLKIDADKGKISLGIKQIEPDPWSLASQALRSGDTVNGRVTKTAPFGAFVEVESGVEGLCPISELAWKRVGRVEDVLQVDQVHMFKIMEIDPGKRRLSLSLKQAAGDPWIGATVIFAVRSIVEGTVLTCTDFGAFVELKPGIEGLVHISELDNKRVNKVTDILNPGDTKQFRVLTVDEDNRRISLSLKQVVEYVAPEPTAAQTAGAGTKTQSQPARPKKPKPGVGGIGKGGAMGMGLGDLKL
ncbi:MAG: S1 RNA-binding domain-containing protein [Phycisphaeraceae bacterium]